MNNTYYFSHDGNARSDAKIAGLLAECGWEGYGIYWMLIECMFEDSDTQIKYKHIHALSFTERVNEELLRRVIAIGIEQELFVSDGDSFWSNGLRDRKDYFVTSRNQKSAAGKKGMENRWKNHVPADKNITVLSENDNGVNNGVIENDNNKKKVNEKIVNEIKEKKVKKVFIVPTLEEVTEYCTGRNSIEPQTFLDYYETRGWFTKPGQKMVDWKAAIRTWEANDRTRRIGSRTSYSDAERIASL